MEKKKIEELFPNLIKEIVEGTDTTIKLDRALPGSERKWAGYNPDAVDFLSRCKKDEEAHEVIDYLEKRGEISREEAEEYREKLEKEGLGAFGEHKDRDYYHRNK
jgi:hypothetical protein